MANDPLSKRLKAAAAVITGATPPAPAADTSKVEFKIVVDPNTLLRLGPVQSKSQLAKSAKEKLIKDRET
jgi:hypothetical protein